MNIEYSYYPSEEEEMEEQACTKCGNYFAIDELSSGECYDCQEYLR